MNCLICNNKFYIRRSLLKMFCTKEEFVCDNCYRKYPIKLSFEKVQLEDYYCFIISMFEKHYYINYNAFINEYSKVFNTYLEKDGYYIIFYDYLSLSDYRLEILDGISKLVDKNLIIITLFLRK